MTDPVNVVCPTCSADPAHHCTSKTGRPTGPHKARRDRADAVAAVDGPSVEAPHTDHPGECAACADGVPLEAPNPYAPLPDELTTGLTVWGDWGGAQMSLLTQLLADDNGEHVLDDNGSPIPVSAEGALALAFRDDAPRAGVMDGGTIYALTAPQARALRDLLNLATARHFL